MNPPNVPLPAAIQSRLIRYEQLIPCKTAFIDANTPGSDRKENFCLIGGGVAENPDQVVHINIPHGFDIGGARQPNGYKNSHHSHVTEEVFFVHKGSWKFTWGHDGSDGEAILHTGDTISIPIGVFRGFENVGPDDGFLYAVLGLNPDGSAGHVTWAPYVFRQAESHGLVLLADGRLVDTSQGTPIPEDGVLVTPTTADDLHRFKRMSRDEMLECVALANDDLARGGLGELSGTEEQAIIGTANPGEHIASGKMAWEHNFQVRRLTLQPAANIKPHSRAEEEVLFVHTGSLEVRVPEAQFVLHAGDLFTVPIGMRREFKNVAADVTDIIVVRRGNHPQPAQFL